VGRDKPNILRREGHVEPIGKLLEQLGYAPFVYTAAVYAFFVWLDKELSEEAKAALVQTLKFKTLPNGQVARAIVEIFDRIYAYPLLRWRAFVRSLLFTLTVTAIFTFVVRDASGINTLQYVTIAKAFLAAIIINGLSDYVSLFAIRPWLVKAGNRPALALIVGTLIGGSIVMFGAVLRSVSWVQRLG
jgi:hypothetical protein